MTQFLINSFVKNKSDTGNKKVRNAYGNLACVVGIICNVLLFAGKFIAGTVFGSVSITADGINNLSDASSNIVSLVGFKLASMPADEKHPFGHARYEYIAGLAVSVMIIVIGIELLKESFAKVLHPEAAAFSWLSIIVLLASIGVKLWMSLFNKKIGRTINSETLIATAADSRNDVISTAAVLTAAIIAYFTGFAMLDGIMGCLVALFIIFSGIGLVRDTLDPILGAAPDADEVKEIEEKVMSYPGVLGLHDMMIHDYGPGNKLISFHIEMSNEADIMESHDLIDCIEKDLMKEYGLSATIHYDPVVTDDPHVGELKDFIREIVREFEPKGNIHDLRIVPGPTHTNVVFDCVMPHEYLGKKKAKCPELLAHIRSKVSEKWPDHLCVIQLESSFTDEND